MLHGSMIPRSVRRMFDERAETREPAESQTAVLEIRGRKHMVRVTNLSPSGAMVVEMSFSMIRARIGETPDAVDRRRSSRLPVELDARVRELGAEGVEARLLNISESGFMAETDGEFDVGSRVWLMLPGRERANAVIKWVAGEKLGAEFAAPISLEGLR